MSLRRIPLLILVFISVTVPARLQAEPVTAEKPKSKEVIPPGFRTVETAITTKVKKTRSTQTGTPQLGFLGLSVEADKKNQLVVQEVAPGSPADKAGAKSGDQVVRIGTERPTTATQFRNAVMQHAPGDKVTLRLKRNDKSLSVTAELVATSRPVKLTGSSSRSSRRRGVLGVSITTSENPKGVKITRIFTRSAAEKYGIKVGDVFLKVNDRITTDRAGLIRQLSGKAPGDEISVLLERIEGKMKTVRKTIKVKLGGSTTSGRTGSSRFTRRYWTKPTYRLAIIGIEYPDVKHNPKIRTKDWNRSFFSRKEYNRVSPTGQVVFGSMNDYYHELSNGKFQIKGKMFDWVTVSKKRAEYSSGTGTSRRGKLMFFREVLSVLTKRDGNGVLNDYDGVVFIYAGSRFRTSRGGLYWPHRSSVTHGRRRMPYFIVPEGGSRMQDISVFCHEFGHMLGLPDLYARPENPGSEGVSVWCAMSNQARGGRPQHFSAWCKEKLEWLKPAVIDPRVKQKLVLRPTTGSSKECYKVLLRPDGSEYFLLENRRRTGFDKSLPAQGLLIWRVINGRPFLEESHGETGPRGPYVFRDRVPYPSSSNNSFTPYTIPSSRSKLGGGWPVHITNIRELPDGRVTFFVGYEFN